MRKSDLNELVKNKRGDEIPPEMDDFAYGLESQMRKCVFKNQFPLICENNCPTEECNYKKVWDFILSLYEIRKMKSDLSDVVERSGGRKISYAMDELAYHIESRMRNCDDYDDCDCIFGNCMAEQCEYNKVWQFILSFYVSKNKIPKRSFKKFRKINLPSGERQGGEKDTKRF
jgi:hypothetical protein